MIVSIVWIVPFVFAHPGKHGVDHSPDRAVGGVHTVLTCCGCSRDVCMVMLVNVFGTEGRFFNVIYPDKYDKQAKNADGQKHNCHEHCWYTYWNCVVCMYKETGDFKIVIEGTAGFRAPAKLSSDASIRRICSMSRSRSRACFVASSSGSFKRARAIARIVSRRGKAQHG